MTWFCRVLAEVSLMLRFKNMPPTIDSVFNSFLDRDLEDLTLSPNLYHPSQLLLDLVRSSFVCSGSRFGNDRRERDEKIILFPSFRLLSNFYSSRSH